MGSNSVSNGGGDIRDSSQTPGQEKVLRAPPPGAANYPAAMPSWSMGQGYKHGCTVTAEDVRPTMNPTILRTERASSGRTLRIRLGRSYGTEERSEERRAEGRHTVV